MITLAVQGEGALFKAGKELDLKSFLEDKSEGPLDEFLKKEVRKVFGFQAGCYLFQFFRPLGMEAAVCGLSWDSDSATSTFESA